MNPERIWWLSCRAYQKRWTLLAKFLKTLNYVLFKTILPYQAVIQRDIRLDHYGLGVVVHPNVQIGHRVRIYQHVTLATETWIGAPYKIYIGDDVTIGAGAIVIARSDTSLTIGDKATVGAGAVVTGNVEAGQTVIGIPARPLKPKVAPLPDASE